MAQAIGSPTSLPSPQIDAQGSDSTGNCGFRHACAHSSNLSSAGPHSPLATQTHPASAFDRLFQTPDARLTPEESERRRVQRLSVRAAATQDAAHQALALGASGSEPACPLACDFLRRTRENSLRASNRALVAATVRAASAGCKLGARASRSVAIAGLACLAALACALAWTPIAPRRTAPIPNAAPVGAAECRDCHQDVQDHPEIAAYHADCEACHGAGSLHAESQEPEDIRFPSSSDCLACHERGRDTHLAWRTGEHARAGLLCSDCHSGHATTRRHLREPRAGAFASKAAAPGGIVQANLRSRVCVECHEDVAARFQYPSHHPVREGLLDCTSCHDPHGDARVALGDPNQRCHECHQDYAGPWVYEHEPVAEDCTECHDPHGAPADDLLVAPQPVVCITCHTLADLWHHNTAGTGIPGNTAATEDFPPSGSGAAIKPREARTFLRECTNCHGAIHGSYTDETLQH